MSGIIKGALQLGVFAAGKALTHSALGGAIASTIFGLLLPQEGAYPSTRLSDLLREGVEVGTPVKTFFGTMPTRGDVFDCGVDKNGVPAGIEEKKKKKKKGGFLGIGGTTVTSYSYYLTAAYMLGEGPLYVERIELETNKGKKVIFDRRNIKPATALPTGSFPQGDPQMPEHDTPEWNDYWNDVYAGARPYVSPTGATFTLERRADAQDQSTPVAELAQTIRVYHGTELQQPDTKLQIIHGEDCPAYRGSAYVMFNRFPLKDGSTTFNFLVRSPITGRREVIKRRLLACGVPLARIGLNSIEGDLRGAAITQVEPVREMIERLAATQLHDLFYLNGGFRDASRANPTTWRLQPGELGASVSSDSEPPVKVHQSLKAEHELASSLTLRYVDPDQNYETREVTAVRGAAQHENPQSVEMPFAMTRAEAAILCDITLDEMWASVGEESLSTLSRRIAVAPGNVLIYDDPQTLTARAVRLNKQALGTRGPMTHTGVPYDAGVYDVHRILSSTPAPNPTLAEPVVPAFHLCELPSLSDNPDELSLTFGACAPRGTEWTGAQLTSAQQTGALSGDAISADADEEAVVCELVDAWQFSDAQLYGFDAPPLRVRVLGAGTLLSASHPALMRDANLLALGNGILQFQNATPVAGQPNTYDLSDIWPGRFNTDWLQTFTSGTRALLLTDADAQPAPGLESVSVSLSQLQTSLSYTVSAGADDDIISPAQTFTPRGFALMPPRPLIVRRLTSPTGTVLCFMPRTRDFHSARATWNTGRATREADPRQFTLVLRDNANAELSRRSITWLETSLLPVEVVLTTSEAAATRATLVHEGTRARGHERALQF